MNLNVNIILPNINITSINVIIRHVFDDIFCNITTQSNKGVI